MAAQKHMNDCIKSVYEVDFAGSDAVYCSLTASGGDGGDAAAVGR